MKQDPAVSLQQLKRGVAELISEAELLAKLKKGKPLRIKAGFDPTTPDLHLGHAVLLQKLKQFQDLGHQVIFLIGDFTASIGDPSGRSKARPPVTSEEIATNLRTYLDQASKILDPDRVVLEYNSRWLGKIDLHQTLLLAGRYTVARMMEREDFKNRLRAGDPLSLQEFFYPLLQGHDSVVLKADLELGGTDQKFNLLVGRELQRDAGQEPQVVMTLPLLVGTDGHQKMSKSFGNTIGLTEPPGEIFGKVMSLPDEAMGAYYQLLTDQNIEERRGEHPKEVKKRLAMELVKRFHGSKEAQQAAAEFDKVFSRRELPSKIDEVILKGKKEKIPLTLLLSDLGLTPSRSEARRMIQQKAVSVNEHKIDDLEATLEPKGEYLIQVGKRRFKKIIFG